MRCCITSKDEETHRENFSPCALSLIVVFVEVAGRFRISFADGTETHRLESEAVWSDDQHPLAAGEGAE
jgi:hypothetical protein